MVIGSSSSFAPPLEAIITVTSTADTVAVDGVVTLREAILSVNAAADVNEDVTTNRFGAYGPSTTIHFNIPGTGVHTIQPLSELPAITNIVVIDGYSQPGASVNTIADGDNAEPKIVLDGSAVSLSANGLTLEGGASIVRGLVIKKFFNGILLVFEPGNTIAGNFIGIDADGSPAGNVGSGIFLLSSGNVVGGSVPEDRNIVSANSGEGIQVESTLAASADNNLIRGNFIGTDLTGKLAIANKLNGIAIFDGPTNNVIGGLTAAQRNLISGNTLNGIDIAASSLVSSPEGNTILGNFIGVDVTGTASLGNGANGIDIELGFDTVIGNKLAGNLISANQQNGILVEGSIGHGQARNTSISGNQIVANGGIGIVTAGLSNSIGGFFGNGNLISSNRSDGIELGSLAFGNTLLRNSIVANGGHGVAIFGDVNQIGNGDPLGSNFIVSNRFNGVFVGSAEGPAQAATIIGNSIFRNGLLGIDLAATGEAVGTVTPNDASDIDFGPNQLQNFPTIIAASSDCTGTFFTVTLNSTPNTTFRIEFFVNSECDPSGFGEGEELLLAVSVRTDINGDAAISTNFAEAFPCAFITATATDPSGNTSEFSQCALVSVADTTPPTIGQPGPDAIIECPNIPTFSPPAATDNCDPNPVVNLVEEIIELTRGCPFPYTRTRVWQAVDACGNKSATVSQSITVVDTPPPSVQTGSDTTIECPDGPLFTTPTATDACDPNPLIQLLSDVTRPGACPGTFTQTLTYVASDCSGNTSLPVSQTITVVDRTPPTITCSSAPTVICSGVHTGTISVSDFIAAGGTASDNCGNTSAITISYTDSTPVGSCPQIFTRTYTAIDCSGNVSQTCSQQITCFCPTLLTDSLFCTLATDQVNLIFTPDVPNNPGCYKLNASNPGQFYLNIFAVGIPGSTTNFDVVLPFPFVTQGARPIQAYDGVSFFTGNSGVTCFVPGTPILVSTQTVTMAYYAPQVIGSVTKIPVELTFPASGFIYMNLHLDYGLKGTRGYNKDSFQNAVLCGVGTKVIPNGIGYTFQVIGAANGTTTASSVNTFKRDPGVGGLVQYVLADGVTIVDPVRGAGLTMTTPTGAILGSTTTDTDGWYMIPYKSTGKNTTFYMTLTSPGVPQTKIFNLKPNSYAEVDFLVILK